MYYLKVKDTFSSAHSIKGYQGKCQFLHGHNWQVESTIEAPHKNELGIVYDLKQLKIDLGKVIEKLDHTVLNDLPAFRDCNPTAENLAKYIFEELCLILPDQITLRSVTIIETENCSVTYTHD
ncbi:6-carboxytetrahydropterin synthase QueD [bacterium]|nr:6-carboxytetrahydropterin synthase QueD [bacterium]